MTAFRPASVAGRPESATVYPATVVGGPSALSDDVTASSYALFPGYDEVAGKRAALDATFDPLGIAPATVEVRLYVEPQTSGTSLRVFATTLDGATVLFDVDPMWSTPPATGVPSWVSTGPIPVTGSAFTSSGFRIGIDNQTPTTGLSADVYVYEMELVTSATARCGISPLSLTLTREHWPEAEIRGTANQLNDKDDATGVTLVRGSGADIGLFDVADGPLPTYSGPDVTEIPYRFRAACVADAPLGIGIEIYDATLYYDSLQTPGIATGGGYAWYSGAITEQSLLDEGGFWTVAEIVSAIRTGANVSMYVGTGSGRIDIAELQFLPCFGRRPPLRGRQRGDGLLGASSAPRGRQHTTRQASLRGNGIL